MSWIGSRLLLVWRRVPVWAKVIYAAGWLLSAAWYSLAYMVAGAAWPRIDLLVLWPLVGGAFWPITLPIMIRMATNDGSIL